MCNKGITQFYPQPTRHEQYQLLPSSPFGWYSLRLPRKGWPGWVDLGGWLHTEINVPHWELNPDTVIHLSTITGPDVGELRWSRSTRYSYARCKRRLHTVTKLKPSSVCGILNFHKKTNYYTIDYTSGLWSLSRRLGLETYQRLVSVSSREKLSTSRSRLGLGRQTSRSRLGLIHLRLVPKINFRLNSAGHSTQCEWALDVVSLCVSYYCSSY